jgi:hypothetical protein
VLALVTPGRPARLVRIDRAPWRSPLRAPRDGGEAAVRDWYRWHFLPFRPGLVRRLPALRGKVLAHAGPRSGAHAPVLVAAANRSLRGADE